MDSCRHLLRSSGRFYGLVVCAGPAAGLIDGDCVLYDPAFQYHPLRQGFQHAAGEFDPIWPVDLDSDQVGFVHITKFGNIQFY